MELKHNFKPYSRIKNTTKNKIQISQTSHKAEENGNNCITKMNIATQNLLLETKLPRIRTVPTPSSELSQKFQYLIIYMTKNLQKKHCILYIVTRNQKIQCKTYTVECIMYKIYNQIKSRFIFPQNQKSLYTIT